VCRNQMVCRNQTVCRNQIVCRNQMVRANQEVCINQVFLPEIGEPVSQADRLKRGTQFYFGFGVLQLRVHRFGILYFEVLASKVQQLHIL
jgi:hypothetical protein